MKKYLLTACYILLTFIIFKHPVELPESEVPKPSTEEKSEQNFTKPAIAKTTENIKKGTIPVLKH